MEKCEECGAPAVYFVDWYGSTKELLCEEHTPTFVKRKARIDALNTERNAS